MPKIWIFLLVFLTCCAPLASPPTLPTLTPVDPSTTGATFVPTADWSAYQPSVAAFQAGADCPHICWLGINPGVTGASEAYHLLQISDQIDQKTLKSTDTGILATWFTEGTKKLNSKVYLFLEKGHVKSISFDGVAPFKMGEVTKLLGDPDRVGIDMEVTDDVMDISYEFYYSSKLVLLGSDATALGPDANDGLLSMSLGISYDTKFFRPWLGYGHLREYLAKKPAP